MKADLKESRADYGDEFVKRLQDSIEHVKNNREMEERYMLFEELLQDERSVGRAEGKAEAVVDLLEGLGSVPESLVTQIRGERDFEVLKYYLKLAARVKSIDDFTKAIK